MINPNTFKVVIRPDPVKEKTKSGLIIAADKKLERGATESGVIVALGPDVYAAFKPSLPQGGLKVGMRVAFARYAGRWVADPESGELLLVVLDEDVICELVGGEVDNVLDPLVAA